MILLHRKRWLLTADSELLTYIHFNIRMGSFQNGLNEKKPNTFLTSKISNDSNEKAKIGSNSGL